MVSRSIAISFAMVVMIAAADPPLSAPDQQRFDRAVTVATERLDEWLGPARTPAQDIDVARPWWSSSAAMDLESQVAFQLARAHFANIQDTAETRAFVDGTAWHLQSRVVEELFDYSQHQPGHHAAAVTQFGGHVRWGVPMLVLSRAARDERAAAPVTRAAAAVATLEGIVGWPSLAAALRLVANDTRASMTASDVRQIMEAALGVPLDRFFRSMQGDDVVNYSLTSVSTERRDCGGTACYQTTLGVRRAGNTLFPPSVDILVEFTGEQRSTLSWPRDAAESTLTFESGMPPAVITVDPEHRVHLDDNLLDQRWRAGASAAARPIKTLAAWAIWLQNAVLTYTVLL